MINPSMVSVVLFPHVLRSKCPLTNYYALFFLVKELPAYI